MSRFGLKYSNCPLVIISFGRELRNSNIIQHSNPYLMFVNHSTSPLLSLTTRLRCSLTSLHLVIKQYLYQGWFIPQRYIYIVIKDYVAFREKRGEKKMVSIKTQPQSCFAKIIQTAAAGTANCAWEERDPRSQSASLSAPEKCARRIVRREYFYQSSPPRIPGVYRLFIWGQEIYLRS